MPKVIDHDKRKQDILRRSFMIFAQKGYQETNLSYIADRCGISRPTLYLYFKDKEEIFFYAMREITVGMFNEYKELVAVETMPQLKKLQYICTDIFKRCYKRRNFFYSLSEFLAIAKRQERDVSRDIDRRTIGLIFLFSRIIAQGSASGEFSQMSAKDAAYELFSLIQAYIFQMSLLDNFKIEQATKVTCNYLETLLSTPSRA